MPTDSAPWQNKYADPKWKERLTKLDPSAESEFQKWAKQNNAPVTPDYDMRGFWKALKGGDPRATTGVNPNDGMMHYTDTWKTPEHKSFSGESIYIAPGVVGPHWNAADQLKAPDGRVLYDERSKPQQFLKTLNLTKGK